MKIEFEDDSLFSPDPRPIGDTWLEFKGLQWQTFLVFGED